MGFRKKCLIQRNKAEKSTHEVREDAIEAALDEGIALSDEQLSKIVGGQRMHNGMPGGFHLDLNDSNLP